MSQPESETSERTLKAAKIIAKPADYKVCEQCDSIVIKRATFCPNCHAYRFDKDPAAVAEQAKKLGSRPQTSVTDKDML